jgi:hypothetical protein
VDPPAIYEEQIRSVVELMDPTSSLGNTQAVPTAILEAARLMAVRCQDALKAVEASLEVVADAAAGAKVTALAAGAVAVIQVVAAEAVVVAAAEATAEEEAAAVAASAENRSVFGFQVARHQIANGMVHIFILVKHRVNFVHNRHHNLMLAGELIG